MRQPECTRRRSRWLSRSHRMLSCRRREGGRKGGTCSWPPSLPYGAMAAARILVVKSICSLWFHLDGRHYCSGNGRSSRFSPSNLQVGKIINPPPPPPLSPLLLFLLPLRKHALSKSAKPFSLSAFPSFFAAPAPVPKPQIIPWPPPPPLPTPLTNCQLFFQSGVWRRRSVLKAEQHARRGPEPKLGHS